MESEKKNKKTNIKVVTREIIIFLLWTLAVILILGVVLYKFVPTNKIIPETISYTTPENVKTALQSEEVTNSEEAQEPITFESKIDSTDLNNYKRTQEYVPGKKNPFASVQQADTTSDSNSNSETTGNTGNNSSSSNSNVNSNTGSSTTTSSGNTNTGNSSSTTGSSNSGYLPDKGTK